MNDVARVLPDGESLVITGRPAREEGDHQDDLMC
jgi:hypothetical protein